MEHMGAEGQVPRFVAKNSVELHQSLVFPFVAPGKFPILQVDFFKLTAIEAVSEVCHSALV